MDVFFVQAAIKSYKKSLKILASSPTSLITGGMVGDILIARSTLEHALNSEPDRDRPRLRNAISAKKLLQEVEQLDLQLKEHTPNILSKVDIARLRNEANMSEFRDQIVIGWWWHLDQDHPSPDD